MSEMKKYMDIVRLGHKTTAGVLKEGDYIVIQEKLDGANASFKRAGDSIIAFSRNTQLSQENNLRGFYEWTQTLEASKLLEGVIYFGEWLVKHKIDYGSNANQFYLFDIFDKNTQGYLNFSVVKDEAIRLSLNLIPVFYEGDYQSFEHLESFIGKTVLGVNEGEGIVAKNVDYQDRYGNQLFVKLVSDSFREVQKQKAPRYPNFKSAEQSAVESVLTKARVEKLIYKLVDENLLDDQFGIEDMGTILKQLGNRVYEDIVKEEREVIKEFEEKNVRRVIGKSLPLIVKSIITEKEAA
ncbi:RNA ligase family protein [Paenibacillus sp. Marseille-Q4541]|uniref:RNA ligase family protein n=1 Tax=Paenibacillus sp. Marseille-Q4541 TaxID=2831522 RepID=UPI001BAE4C8E|nr:RNA ligase family protein [Paenibacillus sp. Marseille-Q4541]